jgi:hypothetical protein
MEQQQGAFERMNESRIGTESGTELTQRKSAGSPFDRQITRLRGLVRHSDDDRIVSRSSILLQQHKTWAHPLTEYETKLRLVGEMKEQMAELARQSRNA